MVQIVPYLNVPNGKKAIEFYKKVFGAKVVDHTPFSKEVGANMGLPDDFDYENSTMHAEIKIQDISVMLSDSGSPNILEKTNAEVLIVPDSLKQMETYFGKAKKEGATIVMELEKQFWGAYYARFKDPSGIGWQLNYTPPPEETPENSKEKLTKKKSDSKKKTSKKGRSKSKKSSKKGKKKSSK